MFCPNCGTKNIDGSEFCEGCGTRIGTQPKVKTVVKEKRALTKSSKILIVEIILLIVVLIASIVTYKLKFSAEKSAQRFVESALDGKWDAVYDLLLIEDKNSSFMTKEAFVTAMALNKGEVSKNAGVSSVKLYSGSLNSAKVKVKYRSAGEALEETMKLQRKGFFWKVDNNNYVMDKAVISVPAGSKVKVDKIDISKKEKPAKEGDVDTYTISPVFGSYHLVEVSKEGMETTKDIMDLSVVEEEQGEEDTVNLVETNYDEETMKTVAGQAVEDFKGILDGAGKNARASDVSVINKMNGEQKEVVVNTFENLRDDGFMYGDEDNFVNTLKLTKSEAKVKNVYENGEDLIRVQIDSDYYIQKTYTGYRENEISDQYSDCSNTLYYMKDGDGWKLYDAELTEDYWW